MDAREVKALEITGDMRISFAAGCWCVHSQTSGRVYKVNPSPTAPACECEDFALRQSRASTSSPSGCCLTASKRASRTRPLNKSRPPSRERPTSRTGRTTTSHRRTKRPFPGTSRRSVQRHPAAARKPERRTCQGPARRRRVRRRLQGVRADVGPAFASDMREAQAAGTSTRRCPTTAFWSTWATPN